MKKTFYVIHHKTNQVDYDWLVLCLSSLRRHSNTEIIVVSDNMSSEEKSSLMTQFNALVRDVLPNQWDGRRMLCKLEQLDSILQDLEDGTQVLMSDTDVVFLGDPFKVFEEQEFDVGYTTRIYKFYTPVNGGIVFFRVSEALKRYSKWVVRQVKSPTWWPYIEKRSSRDNADWNCDQDMLHAAYANGSILEYLFRIKFKDVGFKYNYFAGSGVLGDEPAVYLMKLALATRKYPVLHFKGQRLKTLINELNLKELLNVKDEERNRTC